MSTAVRYQVMPPLASDEYKELYEDIRTNGVLVPVLEDEDGVIIDGHHRSKIASELGIPCPVETISGKSDEEKRGMAFTLNLKRRHLNREQRRALIAESLKADPQLSNREHARRTGADHKTVQTVREESESTGEIPQSDKRVSADGRERPASRPPRQPEPEQPPAPEAPKPRASVLPQEDLDELNTPKPQLESSPEPIPDPESETVLEPEPDPEPAAPNPVHKPIEVPDTQRDHLLDLMAAIRNAEKALQDALLAAHRVTRWDEETPTQTLRDTLDEIDRALASDDLDTELHKLLGGNNA